MELATAADIDEVTETIALAFADDPVWSVALLRADGSTAHHAPYWRLFVEAAVEQGIVHRSDDHASVAVWIPPGVAEISDAQADRVRALVIQTLEPDAQAAIFALWDRFDEHRATQAPHVYLSLLATRPEHRGHGIAQALVREGLAEFDRRGWPAYLESTNPANDHRYERLGFGKVGEFEGATPGSLIATMSRAAGA